MQIEGPLEQSFTLPPRLSRQLADLAEQQGRSPDALMLDALQEHSGIGESVTVKISHDFARHLHKVKGREGLSQEALGIVAIEEYLEKATPHEVIAQGAFDGAQV